MPARPEPTPQRRIERLQRRLACERAARREAQALLAHKSQELRARDQALQALAEQQEALIASRTEALRRARDEALAASSAKTAFLANMSHEIRTPLTSIIGFGELLLEGTPAGAGAVDPGEALHTIVRQGRHLLDVINDILDLSKIETQQVELEDIDVFLPDLLREIEALAAPRARDKGLAFEVQPRAPLPAQLRTDPLRLKQILLNFCSNAVKFTEQGGVRLVLRWDAAAQEVCFAVHDSGIGMSPAQLQRLFRPFTQADASTTRRFGGTGLGLYISRQLAQLLQGRIEVHSRPGEGSCFSLRVPLRGAPGLMIEDQDLLDHAPAAEPPVATVEVPTLSGRVLLAEDGPDNQRLLSLYLRQAGLAVDVVADGRAAVKAALAHDYALVLMDVQMPVMDGVAATELLRAAGCQVPVVALTANVMQHDVQRYRAAGCVDVLAKPVERARFYTTVARHLCRAPACGSPFERIDDAQMLAALRELAAEFRRGLPATMAQAAAALAARDAHALAGVVHTLKGTAGSYGHPELTRLSERVEQALARGDWALVAQRCEVLRDAASHAGVQDATHPG